MKKILQSCTALMAVASFATQAIAAEPLKAIGEGEGALSIVAWAGYIERGETDKNYDWVTDFEKETGCKVSVKTAATSDEMVALMNEAASTWLPLPATPRFVLWLESVCSRSIPTLSQAGRP